MDGRKNNRGTPGNKGGRPPKADELKLIEQMDALAAPAEVWESLLKLVRKGDVQACKLWLAYRFGQPKQSIDHTTGGNPFPSPHIVFTDAGDND